MSSFFYRIGRRDTAAGIEGAAKPFRRNGAERRNPGKPVFCDAIAKSRPLKNLQRKNPSFPSAILPYRNRVTQARFRVETESASAHFGKKAESDRFFGHKKFKTEKAVPAEFNRRLAGLHREKRDRSAAAL